MGSLLGTAISVALSLYIVTVVQVPQFFCLFFFFFH